MAAAADGLGSKQRGRVVPVQGVFVTAAGAAIEAAAAEVQVVH